MTKSKRNSHGVLRTEEFKRPDHNDFRDSSELAKIGFSGVRKNSLTREWEIWLDGELKARGPEKDIDSFAAAYQEVFACSNVAIVELSNGNVPQPKGVQ